MSLTTVPSTFIRFPVWRMPQTDHPNRCSRLLYAPSAPLLRSSTIRGFVTLRLSAERPRFSVLTSAVSARGAISRWETSRSKAACRIHQPALESPGIQHRGVSKIGSGIEPRIEIGIPILRSRSAWTPAG